MKCSVRALALVFVTLLVSMALTGPPASAAIKPFPVGGGWVNPLPGLTYDDWNFTSCNPAYEPNTSHLGADSQGSRAGQTVAAIAPGVVASVATWTIGKAIGIEHTAADGSRFLAVYGHVSTSLVAGTQVTAGQPIATLIDQGPNSHLHLGIRPLSSADDAARLVLYGQSKCTSLAPAPSLGYVTPLPWLTQHPALSPSLPGFGAPVLNNAKFTDGGVNLYFTPPSVPTGATIRNYYYQVSIDGAPFINAGFTNDVTSPAVVGQCSPGQSCTYRLSAQVDAGASPFSNQITVAP